MRVSFVNFTTLYTQDLQTILSKFYIVTNESLFERIVLCPEKIELFVYSLPVVWIYISVDLFSAIYHPEDHVVIASRILQLTINEAIYGHMSLMQYKVGYGRLGPRQKWRLVY